MKSNFSVHNAGNKGNEKETVGAIFGLALLASLLDSVDRAEYTFIFKDKWVFPGNGTR